MKILDGDAWNLFKENCLKCCSVESYQKVANVILDYYLTTDERLFLMETSKEILVRNYAEFYIRSQPFSFEQFTKILNYDFIIYAISEYKGNTIVYGCVTE